MFTVAFFNLKRLHHMEDEGKKLRIDFKELFDHFILKKDN